MIIYEVNLLIENNIFSDFKNWLKEHIAEMLMLDGFIEAKVLTDAASETNTDKKILIVQYLVASLKDLQKYFDHSAKIMRQKGFDKFGKQFAAERRILAVATSYRRCE